MGNITTNKKNGQIIYSVKSIVDINSIIIPHFEKYPLLTQKQADFVLFKNIVELILQNYHLKQEGLIRILELKASLNKGLLPELEKAYPNIKAKARPIIQLPTNLDINWLIGFIDGEGSFFVNITKGLTKIGYLVQINFNLTQHIRDADLFKFIQRWLGCGLIYVIQKESRVNLVIINLQDIINILIPKLNQYPLQGIKRLNFEDFKLVVELIEKKEHLTLEGLNKIRKIKSGMNTARIKFNGVKFENPSLNLGSQKPSLINSIQKIQKISFHTNVRGMNRIGPHNKEIIDIIIGSLLGKAYANKRSGEGVRLCYRQSVKHKEYLFWLYTFFYNRGYTSNLQPRQYTRTIQKKEGKIYYGYEFNTFTFRSFSWIHDMFYKNGRKIIPLNIYEYLTPLALAVWIMDDGGWTNDGIRIATNSFKLKEVELLQDVLNSKYKLETTIQKIYIKDQYSIYIKKQSVNNLRNIVGPNIHFSLLYKLGYSK